MSRCIVRANFPRQDWRPCHRALERLQNEILVAKQERVLENTKTIEKNKHKKKNSNKSRTLWELWFIAGCLSFALKFFYHHVYSFVTKPVSDAEFFKSLSVHCQGCCKVLVFCAHSEWLPGEEPVGQNKHRVHSKTLKKARKTVQKLYRCGHKVSSVKSSRE